jgi:hypothetical protein
LTTDSHVFHDGAQILVVTGTPIAYRTCRQARFPSPGQVVRRALWLGEEDVEPEARSGIPMARQATHARLLETVAIETLHRGAQCRLEVA